MNADVSVVIPVYNAAEFVAAALESALREAVVQQVLVVDDGSTDASLAVCRRIADRDPRVTVLTHENGARRGASASRNLGLEHAACELVAFLDADDLYVPGRFKAAVEMLTSSPDLDGVYEPVEAFFETDEAKREWFRRNVSRVTMVQKKCVPEGLLAELLAEHSTGHFHLNGLTVRRTAVERVGGFDPGLFLVEDTEWSLRLAALCRLSPGRTDGPVAQRRVHGANTIMGTAYAQRYAVRLRMWRKLLRWSVAQSLPSEVVGRIADSYLRAARAGGNRRDAFSRAVVRLLSIGDVVRGAPRLLVSACFWRRVLQLCGIDLCKAGPSGSLPPVMGTRGLVSVIIPTWNRAGLVLEAMESVRRQAYRPIELIVVDDGSTDDTLQVAQGGAEETKESDLSVQVLSQMHGGAPKARNRGLRAAGGAYIQFLDSDCLLLPDKIAQQVAGLEETGADFDYGRCEFASPEGTVLHRSGEALKRDPLLNAVNTTFSCPAPLWKRGVIGEVEWDEDLPCLQDWVFKARIMLTHGRGYYRPEVLCRALVHGGERISAHGTARFLEGKQEAFSRAYALIADKPHNGRASRALSRRMLTVCRGWLTLGDWDQARAALRIASRMSRVGYPRLLAVRIVDALGGMRLLGRSIRKAGGR